MTTFARMMSLDVWTIYHFMGEGTPRAWDEPVFKMQPLSFNCLLHIRFQASIFFISLHLRILRPSWIDIISDIGSEVLKNQMTLRDTTKKQGVKTMVWGFWVAISPLIPSTVHCGHGHCWPGCSVILISDDYRVRNVGTGVSEVPDYSLIRSVRP